ncbi:MAG: hypothetical protein KAZ17_00405 [Sphingorhabdus sp.]|nr:hypothetical protein [Sphingorhabdus sp.]
MTDQNANPKSLLDFLDEQMLDVRNMVKDEILGKIADGRTVSSISAGKVVLITKRNDRSGKALPQAVKFSDATPYIPRNQGGRFDRNSAKARDRLAGNSNR